MKLQLFRGDETIDVEVEGSGDGREVRIGDDRRQVTSLTMGHSSGTVRIDGKAVRFLHERSGGRVRIAVGGECHEFETAGGAAKPRRSATGQQSPETRSPMPGKVLQVSVKPGDVVNAGDPLLILEAMKMENVLVAEIAGTVKDVHVKAGEMVDPGKLLVVITPKE